MTLIMSVAIFLLRDLLIQRILCKITHLMPPRWLEERQGLQLPLTYLILIERRWKDFKVMECWKEIGLLISAGSTAKWSVHWRHDSKHNGLQLLWWIQGLGSRNVNNFKRYKTVIFRSWSTRRTSLRRCTARASRWGPARRSTWGWTPPSSSRKQ